MKRITTSLCVLVLFCFSEFVVAAKDRVILEKDKKHVTESIRKFTDTVGIKNLTIDEIHFSPIADLVEVSAGAFVFYASLSSNYVILGEIFDVDKDKAHWSITQKARRRGLQGVMQRLDPKEMIVYPANPNVARLGAITVFTDVDCSFCRSLHKSVDEINNLGIEVRYLAFPRQGVGTASYQKAVSIWCAEDPKAAMTAAKNGEEILEQTCINPVAEQYELGKRLRIRGTPTIIFENGDVNPGYLSPQGLVDYFKNI